MEQFETARTYTAKSVCDQDTVFSFTITRRTAKSVWIVGESIKEETRRAIKIHDGEECIMPMGSYSMAPMLRASKIKPLETMEENIKRLEYVMSTKGYKDGETWAAVEVCELREKITAIVGAYVPPTMEETDARTPTRTWEAVLERLQNRDGFTTCPGDVYTIRHTPGVICNTLSVELKNTRRGECFLMCLDNKLASWEFLKGLDDTGGREVLYHTRGGGTVPFKESAPYIHRFAS